MQMASTEGTAVAVEKEGTVSEMLLVLFRGCQVAWLLGQAGNCWWGGPSGQTGKNDTS